MRTRLGLSLRIDEADAPDASLSMDALGFDDTSSTKNTVLRTLLPANASDVPVSIGMVTSLLCIICYGDITYKINNSTALTLIATQPAPQGAAQSIDQMAVRPGIFVTRGAVSSLTLSNPSNVTSVRVVIIAVGE